MLRCTGCGRRAGTRGARARTRGLLIGVPVLCVVPHDFLFVVPHEMLACQEEADGVREKLITETVKNEPTNVKVISWQFFITMI